MRNDGIFDMTFFDFGWRQEPRGGIDWCTCIVKLELGWILSKSQISFKEGLDGSDVFPVIVEQVCLNVITIGRGFWNNLSTKVVVFWVFRVQER